MSKTTNYGLHIEESSSTKFADWRKAINGPDGSNTIIIDRVLGEKADKSVGSQYVLLASKWVGLDAPYTQTLSIGNITKEQNGTISVAQGATYEQREAARMAMLSVTGQADGSLTISADGEMPEVDIPVYIILLH